MSGMEEGVKDREMANARAGPWKGPAGVVASG